MIDNPVYAISGGVEVTGDKIHILVNLGGVPYRHFCNKQQAELPLRRVFVSAPLSAYCPVCFSKYVEYRRRNRYYPLQSPGQWQREDGLYLVASGFQWMEAQIESHAPQGGGFSTLLAFMRRFPVELAEVAGTYHYTVDWNGTAGTLHADAPDWEFDWLALLDNVLERTRLATTPPPPSNRWNGRTSS